MPRQNDRDGSDVGLASGHASPYATGGGGAVLEHAYGALLLASLLQQAPVRGLGDEVTPVEVRFQQGASSPVDDLVVAGQCSKGPRTMFVAVRRNPAIGAGSAKFVALMVDYLRMVAGDWGEFDAGRWRLGLAVAAPHTASAEVASLASLARRQRSSAEFRAAVAAPRATSGKIRQRLRYLDDAVAAAAAQGGIDGAGNAPEPELTWQLLQALRIIHLALEGDDPADRSRVVADLSRVTGGPAQAADLWRHLLELSGGYAQAAATVDRDLLLRDLGMRLDGGPRGPAALEGSHRVTGAAVAAPAAVRVSEADPRRLGVHASIRLDGVDGDELPRYVERDVDTGEGGVRALVAKAAERGGFILLVGGSSVGKTRCAYEAIRAVLPDWWIVQPAGPGETTQLAARTAGQTVVWLDEIQRYFGGDSGLTGGIVRELLNAPYPAVIVGTLWPDRYLRYIETPAYGGSDPHAGEREVLELADVVLVAERFSPAERNRAESAAATDRVLAEALGSAGYGLTQTLAAAPQLVKHWEIAKTVQPYAWALLVAAVDLRWLGVQSALPEALLRCAAPGYCTDQQRAEAPADWFEGARAYATRKLYGATAALSPVGGTEMGQTIGYEIADYLLQHVGRARDAARIPASAWEAVLAHLDEPSDLVLVAESASDRMLYRYAVPLYRRAADAGNQEAADQWVVHTGDPASLDDLRVRAEDADSSFEGREASEAASASLAEALVRLGELDRLRGLFRPTVAFERGWRVSERLAQVLADRGETDDLRRLADRGDQAAAEQLAAILARRGGDRELRTRADFEASVTPAGEDRDQASFNDEAAPWRNRARRQQTAARARLAAYLAHRNDLAQLAARTDEPAARRLFTVLRHRGDIGGLRRLARQRGGRIRTEFVQLLAHRGAVEELMSLASDAGEMLQDRIARVLVHRGAVDELETLAGYQRPAADLFTDVLIDHGELARLTTFAARNLLGAYKMAKVLTSRGDLAALRSFAAVSPDPVTAQMLNTVLVHRGLLSELASRAGQGDRDAADKLARALADRGDADGAQRALRAHGDARQLARKPGELFVDLGRLTAQADSGDEKAAARLATALARRGDLGQLKARASAGDESAVFRLVEVLVDRSEVDELRSLADCGHWQAAQALADVLVHRGHIDELTVRADRGDERATERLLELLVRRGDLDALRRRADAGDHQAERRWNEMIADRGDIGRLRAWASRDFRAREQLAHMLVDRGDLDELRTRADNGDYHSGYQLAGLLADRDELDELRARADKGDTEAQSALAKVLADRDEINELRARSSEHPEDALAAHYLVELLIQRGDLAEAQRMLLARVLIGDKGPGLQLPELLVRLGRHDDARRLARYGLNPDGSPADSWPHHDA